MASKSKTAPPPTTYQVGDFVLGKVKGFPPWPARIVDPDSPPRIVQKERPRSNKTTFYCVRFFPAGDYAWQVAKDMSKLLKHEIEAYINEPHRKSGDLLTAYKIALEPDEWEAEQAERQALAQAAEKNAQVDELEEEGDADDDGAEPGTKNKKRKRESEGVKKAAPKRKSEGAAPKKAAPKTPKAKSGSPATTTKPKKGRGKKNGVQSAPIVESEDEGAGESSGKKGKGDDDQDESERPSKRAKKEDDEDNEDVDDPEANKVKAWRHALQRAFLTKASVPKEDEMPTHSETLAAVEEYAPRLTVNLLQSTKIGKVMRKITQLPESGIPRDKEFHIRDRAQKLVTDWQVIVNKGPVSAANGSAAPAETNGTTKHEPVPETEAVDDKAMDVDATPTATNDTVKGIDADVVLAADADAEGDKLMDADADADAIEDAEGEKVDEEIPAAVDPVVVDIQQPVEEDNVMLDGTTAPVAIAVPVPAAAI